MSKKKKKKGNMACMSDQAEHVPVHMREKTGTKIPILEKATVTIDLNGKTTSWDGMQPARLKRTTSHLFPHLGGAAASNGTCNRAGVYTLARACASDL